MRVRGSPLVALGTGTDHQSVSRRSHGVGETVFLSAAALTRKIGQSHNPDGTFAGGLRLLGDCVQAEPMSNPGNARQHQLFEQQHQDQRPPEQRQVQAE